MKTIVLISCVSKKLPHSAKAEDLYISPLFKMNLQYARSSNPAHIFILSAKYGLLELNREIEPYDITLNEMSDAIVKEWADTIIKQLQGVADLENDKFVFLAGKRYRKCLIPYISKYEIPMQGLGIGEQLHFLKKHLSKD
jgi:cytoplasmic iron level regulating protein YaaA (DUF328/UPF0246 family)